MGTVEEGSMSNRTGMVAGLTASPWALRGVVLAGALVVAQPAVTFGAGVDTYKWLGELVALDESARKLTVTSRVIAQGGLDVAGLEPGDPILITWSGSDHGANGIAAVAPDDGAGLAPGDRFRLRARFVAADAAWHSLTFSVSGPSSELAPLRAAMQGTWATVTSPHRPAHGPAAVTAVDAYGAGNGHGPAAGDTYDWNAELVSLDDAGRSLTVRSRLVSPTAAADGLKPGDAIRITWSGYRDRAAGVRAVRPADDSGLWGSERFLIDAELVAMDSRYVTFSVEPPADSIDALRGPAAGRVGHRHVAAPAVGQGQGGRRLRGVAGRRPEDRGRRLPLARRAGVPRRRRQGPDRQVAPRVGRGRGVGGGPRQGRLHRHHLVGLRGPDRRHPRRRARLGAVGRRRLPAAGDVRRDRSGAALRDVLGRGRPRTASRSCAP